MILILGCPSRCMMAVIQGLCLPDAGGISIEPQGLMFSVAQAGLDRIVILLPQLPKLWD